MKANTHAHKIDDDEGSDNDGGGGEKKINQRNKQNPTEY